MVRKNIKEYMLYARCTNKSGVPTRRVVSRAYKAILAALRSGDKDILEYIKAKMEVDGFSEIHIAYQFERAANYLTFENGAE